jgi:ABC-type dipeptide/oligopeptide/nickel transport system permease subunit
MNAKIFIKTFMWNRKAKFGVVLVSISLIMALFAEWISPYNPYKLTGLPYEKPSLTHPLGTDDIGRDLLSQLIYGSRISLTVGVLSAAIATFIGVIVGMLAGYMGGWLDEILMRLTDVVLTLPYVVFAIVLVAYLGPNIFNMILTIGILGWPSIARMVRSQVLSLKTQLYVEAAIALGATKQYIMLKYILPNLLVLIIPVTILTIVEGILTEAGLSFLGLGDLSQISWGLMLFYAQTRGGFLKSAWWWILPPGLMITLTSLGMILLGQALDDVLKLKMHLIKV